jgi:ribosomal protein S18 acetylase RimI-like enzyme
MTTDVQTAPLTQNRAAAARGTLVRAFWEDPFIRHVFPDEDKRQRPLDWFFKFGVGYGLRYGAVDATGATDGVAVWLPPGASKMTMPRLIRSGFPRAPLAFGLSSFQRFFKAMNLFEHLEEQNMPGPHWHLFLLGVDPSRQGQGVGGALMALKLPEVDASGLPCYLETALERNLPFYRRHGFEVVTEQDLPAEGPPFWTMVRPPAE